MHPVHTEDVPLDAASATPRRLGRALSDLLASIAVVGAIALIVGVLGATSA